MDNVGKWYLTLTWPVLNPIGAEWSAPYTHEIKEDFPRETDWPWSCPPESGAVWDGG